MTTRFRSIFWFWCSLGCLLVIMTARFGILHRRSSAAQATPTAAAEVVPLQKDSVSVEPPPEAIPRFEFVGPLLEREPPHRLIADSLRHGDSIYLSLKRHRIAELQIAQLNRALEKIFDSRSQSRPGDSYCLTVDTSGVVHHFEYVPVGEPERPVVVERRDGEFVGQRLDLPLTTRLNIVEVRIEDNLSNAMSAIGEEDAITGLLADDIFGSVVDFTRDPRRGDRIGLVFEKLYQDDRFVRYGRILLARYQGQIVDQLGVYFEDQEGHRGYYDDQGKSLERMFLLYAVSQVRVTSRFNRKRFHPVLKKTIPHLGTDYGAPVGTPVHATARGRVVHAGWKGALGKAVIIEHANGYVTRYGHLSRVLTKKGRRVQQKDLIGKVGATGRVTGPHLHYEIIKNGRHLNPETINRGTRGEPLKKKYLTAFGARRDSLLVILESGLVSGRMAAVPAPATAAGASE